MAGAPGVSLAELVTRLSPVRRGKGGLSPAPSREAIGISKAEAVPASEEPGAGALISPLVEQAYAGSVFYELTDSSGLLVLEYGDTVTLIDNDGAGDTYLVKLDDPTTP